MAVLRVVNLSYNHEAATDAGFSSSWSKDGRKFAVASQGKVLRKDGGIILISFQMAR